MNGRSLPSLGISSLQELDGNHTPFPPTFTLPECHKLREFSKVHWPTFEGPTEPQPFWHPSSPSLTLPTPLGGTTPPTRLHKPPVSPCWDYFPPCPSTSALSSDNNHRLGSAPLFGAPGHPVRKGSPSEWSLGHPNLRRAPGRGPFKASRTTHDLSVHMRT